MIPNDLTKDRGVNLGTPRCEKKLRLLRNVGLFLVSQKLNNKNEMEINKNEKF